MTAHDHFERASRAAVLATLATNGVLAALLEGPASAEVLADRLELHEGALARALDVLVAMGLLERERDTFAVDADLQAQAAQGPAPLAAVLALLQGLPQHLRTGNALVADRRDRGALYAKATPGLGRMFAPAARQLAELLPPAATILDVGAGSGVWSLAMARSAPACEVTAVDLEAVLGAFREAAVDVPHHTVAGDYHEVDPGGPFDRVVLANVLHLEPPARASRLLRRAAGWTRPGGELVVVDTLLRNAGNALTVSSYALHLGLRIQGSQVHDAMTVAQWAADVGLGVAAFHLLDPARGLGALVLQATP